MGKKNMEEIREQLARPVVSSQSAKKLMMSVMRPRGVMSTSLTLRLPHSLWKGPLAALTRFDHTFAHKQKIEKEHTPARCRPPRAERDSRKKMRNKSLKMGYRQELHYSSRWQLSSWTYHSVLHVSQCLNSQTCPPTPDCQCSSLFFPTCKRTFLHVHVCFWTQNEEITSTHAHKNHYEGASFSACASNVCRGAHTLSCIYRFWSVAPAGPHLPLLAPFA